MIVRLLMILLLVIGAIAPGALLAAGAGEGVGEGAAGSSAIDPQSASWDEITGAAEGTHVRIYMWGGSETVNRWIDGYVADALAVEYGIDLVRVPMDAAVFVNKLLAEKQARTARGTIDILWINGENFRTAREANLLWGPITALLPNFAAYVNPTIAEFDAGYPTEGYEAPWGRSQFNFDVDTARVSDPPTSFTELAEWVRENPGRFTYPQPPDFTGSAFVRQAFYAVTGGREQYAHGFDRELFQRNAPALWEYLNGVAPYLWQEGESYPRDLATLDSLFERGTVDFTMSFTQTNAATRVANGRYPETVRSFVMEDGSLYNTHFLAVPFNAPNVPGALTAINFLLSPEAQYSKNRLENWGDFTILAIDRLPAAYRERFAALDLGEATVPLPDLDRTGVPEISAEYWEALEAGWNGEVRLGR